MAVQPRPEGYHTITPYLVVPDVDGLLTFLAEGLGAEPTLPPLRTDDGRVMHAEVRIGDSRVMMGQSSAEHPPLPAMLHLYVEDVDAAFRRAVQAGATPVREPTDQFYGDRSGGVRDANGNVWWFATHVEDVSQEEIERRAKAI